MVETTGDELAAIARDAGAILRATPDLYLVLLPDLRIAEASDAYLRATMTTRAALVGRNVFDAFPDDPAEQGADGVANLRASLARVLLHRRPDRMAVQRYPVRRPESEGGEFEERYWSPLNTPVLRDDSSVAYILHRVEDVTERVGLERDKLELDRALSEASVLSRHYVKLLDTAPDALVVVRDDARIELVNGQTEALFGYTRDELLGQPLEVLIPERFRGTHFGHMSRFFANPLARPMGSSLELFGRRSDGSELPIEVSLSPQYDELGMTVSASIRDITERKKLEATARLTADRLHSAVDSIQDAFALFDGEDRLILCNSVFRRLAHDHQPGALAGKSFSEILDAWIGDIDFPDAAARERFRNERLARRAQEATSTFDIRMRDGRSLRVTDRRTPEGGIVKTIWDLTDDERRANELREARAAAETASAAKSDFLSGMSHELRTPLNAILGFAQLLMRDQRQPLNERHRERVEHIMSGGEHLLRLINDILDLARIEAGRISISPEPVNVAEVLGEVTRTLDPISARQSITLAVDAPPSSLPMVIADRTRFVQILMNLGSNAIKYNRPGGRVHFAVAVMSSERVRITVSDTGIGVPLEKQDRLFQPFQRAGQEAGPIEGTGIGLVITKRLVELMDGSVGFHSVPARGSEFWIEMPVQRVSTAPTLPPVRPGPSVITQLDGEHRLVLYVEDNPANVVFMRDLMSTFESLELVTLPTAELGVELARSRCPDIVIMDINLPGMSGLDALRALRADPATQRIPVIALTAAASERDRQRGMEAGFSRYLAKPIKVDELLDAIEALLSAPRAR